MTILTDITLAQVADVEVLVSTVARIAEEVSRDGYRARRLTFTQLHDLDLG